MIGKSSAVIENELFLCLLERSNLKTTAGRREDHKCSTPQILAFSGTHNFGNHPDNVAGFDSGNRFSFFGESRPGKVYVAVTGSVVGYTVN